jgi:hypothetical protein
LTPRKRWPDTAETARTDSIKSARRIFQIGQDAKEALRRGDRTIVFAEIAEMQIAAQQIEAALKAAKTLEREE